MLVLQSIVLAQKRSSPPRGMGPHPQSLQAFALKPLHPSGQQRAAADSEPLLPTVSGCKLAWRSCALAPQSSLLPQYRSQPEESEGSPGQPQHHKCPQDCGQDDGQQHGPHAAWLHVNTAGQCGIGGAELERGSGLACASLQAGASMLACVS